MDTHLSHSQNFIKSNKLLNRLIEESNISSNDLLIDIGAGKGKISKLLATRAHEVWAIEKDNELADHLRRNLTHHNIKVINEDFLRFQLPSEKEYKIFSNIPFNRTAEIMHKLLHSKNPPIEGYLIMQKEAAERYCGSEERESQTSVFHKSFMNFQIVHHFRSTDFTPVPKVRVVLLHFSKKVIPTIKNEDRLLYEKFIIYGFNQWSKNIADGLKMLLTHQQLKRLATQHKFSLNCRPSEIRATEWEAIFNYFIIGSSKEKKAELERFYRKYQTDSRKIIKLRRTRIS